MQGLPYDIQALLPSLEAWFAFDFRPEILFRGVLFASPEFVFPDERISLENCFVRADLRTVKIVKEALSDEWDLNVVELIAQFRGREERDGN